MTVVTRQFRENRLAKLVLKDSGLREDVAAASAEANLATIHDACVAEVDHEFDRLRRSAADPRVDRDPAIQREIYARANSIAGLAGCCGLGEMGEAAFSLCELVDRQIAQGGWSARALTVHIDAMTLLRGLDSDLTPEGRKALIDGLRTVAVSAPKA